MNLNHNLLWVKQVMARKGRLLCCNRYPKLIIIIYKSRPIRFWKITRRLQKIQGIAARKYQVIQISKWVKIEKSLIIKQEYGLQWNNLTLDYIIKSIPSLPILELVRLIHSSESNKKRMFLSHSWIKTDPKNNHFFKVWEDAPNLSYQIIKVHKITKNNKAIW